MHQHSQRCTFSVLDCIHRLCLVASKRKRILEQDRSECESVASVRALFLSHKRDQHLLCWSFQCSSREPDAIDERKEQEVELQSGKQPTSSTKASRITNVA